MMRVAAATVAALCIAAGGAASQGTKRVVAARTGAIAGTVYDSLRNAPLAGTAVYLAGTAYTATTDARGAFRFDSLPAGRYVVSFAAPSLDSLGIDAPYSALDVEGGRTDSVALAVPAKMSILGRICPATALTGGRGLLVGVVHDAASGAPVKGAAVMLAWKTWSFSGGRIQSTPDTVRVSTDTEGGFRVCGVPGDGTLAMRARQGANETGVIEVYIPTQSIVRRDLSIGTTEVAAGAAGSPSASAQVPHGTATLVGRVSAGSQPVAGVQIELAGTELETATDSAGRFRLSGLPAGTWTVGARRLGFSPVDRMVDLQPGHTTELAITFAQRVVVLNPVNVLARAHAALEGVGFYERARKSPGAHFYDQGAIDSIAPDKLSEVLRRVPGVEVVWRGDGEGPIIEMRRVRFSDILNAGDCPVAYYVDGVHFEVPDGDIDRTFRPAEIGAIDVYPGASTVPAQYGGARSGCGVIALWTRARLAHVDSTKQTATTKQPADTSYH